jgi:hypothetical protein
VVLIGYEPVPRDWFPASIKGTAVLCLASGGGQQGPDLYIFDAEALETRAEFVVRHRVPFSTLDLPEAERLRVYGGGPIEYSHTLTAQIGGQLVLTHLVEAPHQADATARYMPGYFATRAVKPPAG